MKKNRKIKKCLKQGCLSLGILIVVLAVFQDLAQAKMIRGEVVAVKDDGSSFSVQGFNPSQPSIKKQYDIVMRADTKFEKISSPKELAAGDEVAVDVVPKRESNVWEANSVRIFKLRLYQTDMAQKKQPD